MKLFLFYVRARSFAFSRSVLNAFALRMTTDKWNDERGGAVFNIRLIASAVKSHYSVIVQFQLLIVPHVKRKAIKVVSVSTREGCQCRAVCRGARAHINATRREDDDGVDAVTMTKFSNTIRLRLIA